MARILTASLLTVTILACQPDYHTAGASGIEVRDSAGIHIIENPCPAGGSRLDWRIGPEPTVSVGESDGEEPYLLYVVRDAMLGSLETPRGPRIFEIGEDYILGRMVGELDVESVQLWPLARDG